MTRSRKRELLSKGKSMFNRELFRVKFSTIGVSKKQNNFYKEENPLLAWELGFFLRKNKEDL